MKKTAILTLLTALISCSSQKTIKASGHTPDASDRYVSSIEKINSTTPETLSATISLWAKSGGKKIIAKGKIFYDKSGDRWRVTLRDPFLGTNIFHILIENGKIEAYSTTEKILLRGNMNASSLFSSQYDITSIFIISSGKIPLVAPIRSFSRSGDEAETILSAKNGGLEQSIKFAGSFPSTVSVKNSTGQDYVIQYKNRIQVDGEPFTSKIHAEEKKSGEYFDIEYSAIKTGQKLPEGTFRLSIPSDARVMER